MRLLKENTTYNSQNYCSINEIILKKFLELKMNKKETVINAQQSSYIFNAVLTLFLHALTSFCADYYRCYLCS